MALRPAGKRMGTDIQCTGAAKITWNTLQQLMLSQVFQDENVYFLGLYVSTPVVPANVFEVQPNFQRLSRESSLIAEVYSV